MVAGLQIENIPADQLHLDKLPPATDIAAMKIMAVVQQGQKRDFIDLYWYCQNHQPLSEVIQAAIHQYPQPKPNIPHLLKSLVYFADADDDPDPVIFFTADWPEVKKYFISEVPKITTQLLDLDL